ncbi:uncharacterized protein PG998_000095 [Apiospora kogelbergensis]|uniref:uncharacterized protein n=1 Tax=Apiospora kogelbergensis TaxID=1337665 RepID=UPI003130FD91
MTATASREMGPNPVSFGSMWWENQFKTTIPLPPQDDSLSSRVAIITGANSGLGFETAKQMLGAGLSCLVMGVRSIQRGQDAAAQLKPINPSAVIHVWEVDMESYASIQSFAKRCESSLDRIDFAILNAGFVPADHACLSTGHESTVQVNFLSTVLLGILLLPVLKAKRPADRAPRLITISTATVRNAKFPNQGRRPLLASFDEVTTELLAQAVFERAAARYVDPRDVVVLLLEPGWVRQTGLMRALPAIPRLVVRGILRVCGRPVDQGAATYFDAAVHQPEASHGSYIMNCKVAPYADMLYTDEAEAMAEALWDETMTELSFANALGILESMKRN